MKQIIPETFERLMAKARTEGVPSSRLQAGFIAGLYAASAAMAVEGARSKDISEAAFRVEKTR